MRLDPLAIATFISYLTLVMLVGVVAYFLTRSLSDYVLGGRRLGGAVAALSAGASDMSSWLLFSLPGTVYLKGIQEIWVAVGLTLGAYISWRFIAKRLRIYSAIANDSLTIPAYLDNRFRDTSKRIRVIGALATLIFFIFYIASGLYAGGILLERTFGLEYTQALWLGAVIIMGYTSIGGFLAVSWTDFFQGTLMLFCLLLVPFFAIQNMGGWEVGLRELNTASPDYLNLTKGLSVLNIISNFSWGLGYFGMSHILVRFMSVKTVREIPLARRICISWMSLSMLGAIVVGVVGSVHFCHCPLDNHETVFMALSEQVFPSWIMGIILAAILSSSMCAIDSQMLAASSALTEDFYRAIFRKQASERELMWVGRLTVILLAAVSLYIAHTPRQSIMVLVSFAWAGLGSTFGSVIILSLFWKRTTRNGVIAGMIVGSMVVIVWRALGFSSVVYEILPGFFGSFIAVILVSLLGKKPEPEILREFDEVRTLAMGS